jgi:hypothetical protein
MSIDGGRKAIETYWLANWIATPTVGLAGRPAVITVNMLPVVRLTIRGGLALTRSIGRATAGQNVMAYICTLTAEIWTLGADGDVQPSIWTDAILDLFHGKTLDSAGAIVTTGAQAAFVRFTPPELGASANPYPGPTTIDAPMRQSSVIIPFVRYEIR